MKKPRPTSVGELLIYEFLSKEEVCALYLAKDYIPAHLSYKTLDAIISEGRSITEEMAGVLAAHFGTTAEFWMNAQEKYQEWANNFDFEENDYLEYAPLI